MAFVRTVLVYVNFIAFGLTAKQPLFSTQMHRNAIYWIQESTQSTTLKSYVQSNIEGGGSVQDEKQLLPSLQVILL